MTKLSVTDHSGHIHHFDQPVSICMGKHGELMVYHGDNISAGQEPIAGFSAGWSFEWGVRHEAKRGKSRGDKPSSQSV